MKNGLKNLMGNFWISLMTREEQTQFVSGMEKQIRKQYLKGFYK